jgi:outer membrane protein
MKKILTVLSCATILVTTASADFTRVEMGIGAWAQKPSGKLSYTNSGATANDESRESQETQAYVWGLIKHPIPVLPNIRLEYTNVENTGLASGTFKEFTAPANTHTTLTMKQYDVIPYYNILDNTTWITLDLGLDLKVIDAKYEADGVTVSGVPNTNYSDSATVVIPLLYVRARAEIPSTNIGLEGDVKYISYNSNTVYDVRAKVDYTLDIFPVVQPAIELGYRMQKIKIDDDSVGNLNADLDFAGVYAGVMIRF